MLDPFAALEEGGIGADVLMDPAAVDEDYQNGNLRLVRCYRDGHLLRRCDDDAFVRRLRDEHGDPRGEIPADASRGQEAYSPLLAIDIPPGFVTLDTPDAENVVTRVLALDIDLDKLVLVAKLGSAVEGDGPDAERIESVVDQLAGFQHVPGFEALVEQHLF